MDGRGGHIALRSVFGRRVDRREHVVDPGDDLVFAGAGIGGHRGFGHGVAEQRRAEIFQHGLEVDIDLADRVGEHFRSGRAVAGTPGVDPGEIMGAHDFQGDHVDHRVALGRDRVDAEFATAGPAFTLAFAL